MAMRSFITSIIVFILIAGIITVTRNSWYGKDTSNRSGTQSSKKENLAEIMPYSGTIEQSIFIPYWNIPTAASDVNEYDTLIYFGVSYDATGALIRDSGLLSIETFLENTSQDTERLLTVRMLDTEVNLAILDDVSRQSLVISQTLDLVEQYGFDGVVLDLEMGVIPLEDTKHKITSFVERFADEVQNGIIPQRRDNPDNTKTITFGMTIYGDSFYRARPYDVEKLALAVDQVYIMAYDFHKSRGEPGPNFPFFRENEPPLNPPLGKEGNERGGYGYDFQTMIGDFTSVVPSEKLTILFGMYGYDWTLGSQGKPLKAAKAIPLNEIENGYSNCRISVIPDLIRNPEKVTGSPIGVGDDKCVVSVDTTSKEKHIRYVDDEGYDHILWYEDKESVKVKIEYLKKLGIGSVGYWVWGYF